MVMAHFRIFNQPADDGAGLFAYYLVAQLIPELGIYMRASADKPCIQHGGQYFKILAGKCDALF